MPAFIIVKSDGFGSAPCKLDAPTARMAMPVATSTWKIKTRIQSIFEFKPPERRVRLPMAVSNVAVLSCWRGEPIRLIEDAKCRQEKRRQPDVGDDDRCFAPCQIHGTTDNAQRAKYD